MSIPLPIQQDYIDWKAVAHAVNNSNADAIFFQETNIAWDKIH